MNWNNFLSSGYTFNNSENELASRYMLVNILLLSLFILLFFSMLIWIMLDVTDEIIIHAIALILILFSFYLARNVGKNNYKYVAYIMNIGFFVVIVLGNFYGSIFHPLVGWAIIQIFIAFLILDIKLSLSIFCMYAITILLLGIYIFDNNILYILFKITPLVFASMMVFILDKKIFDTMILLDTTNQNLENKIVERTKEIEIEKGKLYQQANYDFLTLLPNRNNFYTTIKNWIDKDKDKNLKFALFFIDIDRFKRVNDSLGHEAGDAVLKAVSNRFTKIKNSNSCFYRISGDEFTLLLKYDDEVEIESMVSKIQKTMYLPIMLKEQSLHLTVSIGISIYPYDSVYHVDLIRYADTSMFESKRNGTGLYRYYSRDMTQKLRKNVILESELHYALKNNEFTILYQHIIDISTNTIVGLEALIRWEHPALGMVSPDSFLPLAGTTGLIVFIDYYILKEGMKQIVIWKKNNFNIPRISFNISSKHLKEKLFIEKVKEFLNETSCKAEWIELEITESYVMEDLEEAIGILTALRELGVTIAIDDFGTGYTSLAYLEKLPVDKLKIDKYFIANIDTNSVNQTIVKSIIDIAKSIGLGVTAEGVETELERAYLLNVGCHVVQGYLYHRPMPVERIGKTFSMSL